MELQPILCPQCNKPLRLEKHHRGGLWRCPQCAGVAANLAVLRRHLEEDIVNDFWRRSLRASVPTAKNCPSCSHPLREFVAGHEGQWLRLDVCRRCQLIWFDAGELGTFRKSKKQEPSQVDQRVVLARIQAQAQTQQDTEKLAYYVGLSANVLALLLRLFL